MALVPAAVRIDDDDAPIAVSVRDVGFIRPGIDEHVRRPPEVLLVVAATLLPRPANLKNELAGRRELQDLAVLVVVAADPDVALVVDAEAVFPKRPVITLARPAPRIHECAVRAELEHGRRRDAACAERGIQRRGLEVDIDAALAVQNEDMIAGVDGETDRRSENPAIRQRLRPEGIDFERRCDDAPIALRRPAGGLRNGAARRGAREREERGGERQTDADRHPS